jgi:hypothetical protein
LSHCYLTIKAIYSANLTGTHVDLLQAANQASNMGGLDNMADDRMKNDDAQKNMGQQSPGRSGQSGQQGGQQAGGQQGGQKHNLDDDEFATGQGQSGGQGRGGQNR